MDHELASLGGGAGEACTQDQSVETGLKIGQHGVAVWPAVWVPFS